MIAHINTASYNTLAPLLSFMAEEQPASPSMPPVLEASQPAKFLQATDVSPREGPNDPLAEGADVAEGTQVPFFLL